MTDSAAVVAAYGSAFERLMTREGAEPSALTQARREAMASFLRRGLPSHREPDWRHAAIGALTERAYLPPEEPPAVGEAHDMPAHWLPAAYRLVFVDGTLMPQLSDLPRLANGFIGRWGEALQELPDLVLPPPGAAEDYETRPFVALNAGLAEDGAAVVLPAGTHLERPLQLVFWTTAAAAGRGIFPRNIVRLGRDSQITLVESYLGRSPASCLVCPVTEMHLAPGAQVASYRWLEESAATHYVGAMRAVAGAGSRLGSHVLNLCGATVRVETEVILAEPGAQCTLDGLYLPTDQQTMDHRLHVHHRQVGCTSRQLYKGVVDGQGRAVFHGRIRVHPGAQQTDARQANHNLLLSRQARVQSIPQLEILADDVQCSHGATVGQIDEEALFLLRARGIDASMARSLLVYAFVAEVVDCLALGPLRGQLLDRLAQRLPQGNLIGEIEALARMSLVGTSG